MSVGKKILLFLIGAGIYVGIGYIGTLPSLPLTLRVMIAAFLPAVLLVLIAAIIIYAIWSSWKHRNTASLLLLLVSLMLGLMAGPLWLDLTVNYGAAAWDLAFSKHPLQLEQAPQQEPASEPSPALAESAPQEEQPLQQETMREEATPAQQEHKGIIFVKNQQELDKALQASTKPVLLKGSTTWCPPCQQMKPIFAKLATEMNDQITFIELDADNFVGGDALNIKSLPTFIGYKNGKEVFRFVGGRDAASFKKEVSKLLQ